jgi:membrane-associated phospholipid phosphatase
VVILSAIPIGGHYLVDLLAGSLCWAFVYFLWRFVLDREWLREGQLPLADTR